MLAEDRLTDGERVVLSYLRGAGYTHTFYIRPDCLLCHDTDSCYPASAFEVKELHGFGTKAEDRKLIYGVVIQGQARGIVVGISEELNRITDPTLYSKLLLI